jgi:tetratricopeptide (TPR) repeat protein
MDCQEIRERHIADEYLAGRLRPDEAEAYEEHYFACDACLEDLRFRQTLSQQLEARGEEVFAREIAAEARAAEEAPDRERVGVEPAGAPRARHPSLAIPAWVFARKSWVAATAAAAALFVAAMLVGQRMDRETERAGLWHPLPYPYVASALRGDEGDSVFRQGMALYQTGRYADAAQVLEQHVAAAADDDQALFYLGVSYLLADDARKAVGPLVEAHRLRPDARLYRWYLALAELKSGELDRAADRVRALAMEEGEFDSEARELLRRIDAAR